MPPDFLTLSEVLDLHLDQIRRYGGDASMRDVGLLESAVAQPEAMFGGEYLHADLSAMAAAYLFHIVKNHPFVDGNKRTGATAAVTFLLLNGVLLDLPKGALAEIVLDVVSGEIDKQTLATVIRANSYPH